MATPEKRGATFVSAFFDLAAREKNTQRRQKATYFQEAAWLFDNPTIEHMVIFVEPGSADEIRKLVDPEKHKIVLKEFSGLPAFSDYERVSLARKKNPVVNEETYKFTPSYILWTWSKFDLLREVIATNPFGSTRFAWIDLGIHHIYRDYGSDDHELPEAFVVAEDKIKILITARLRDVAEPHIRRGAVAGGYMSGGGENVARFCDLFAAERERRLGEGFAQTEEEIIPQVIKENPDLFAPYYGDTRHIFSNYVHMRGGTAHILSHIVDSALAARDWRLMMDVCVYIWGSIQARAYSATLSQLHHFFASYFAAAAQAKSFSREISAELIAEYKKLLSVCEFRYLHESNREIAVNLAELAKL